MAGRDAKPKVVIETVKLGKVWDDKACRDAPGWVEQELTSGLSGKADLVSSASKAEFILKPYLDPVDFNPDKGELSARLAVAVTDAGRNGKAVVSSGGRLSKVDEAKVGKSLRKIIDGICAKCASEALAEIEDLIRKQ
jgi:hypothetical protein